MEQEKSSDSLDIDFKDHISEYKYFNNDEIRNLLISLKTVEIELKKKELLFKDQEITHKKYEIFSKYLENIRYEQETEHQRKINKYIEESFRLKNIENNLKNIEYKLNILNNLGLNSSIDKQINLEKLMAIFNEDKVLEEFVSKINKDKEFLKNLYT